MGSVECSWSQRTMLARSYVWPVWKTITGSRITSCQLITSESFDQTADNRLRSRPERGDLRARMRIRVGSARRSRGASSSALSALPGPARQTSHLWRWQQPPTPGGAHARCCSAPEDCSNACPLHRQCPKKMKSVIRRLSWIEWEGKAEDMPV
jgi:hypothetical protein